MFCFNNFLVLNCLSFKEELKVLEMKFVFKVKEFNLIRPADQDKWIDPVQSIAILLKTNLVHYFLTYFSFIFLSFRRQIKDFGI